MEHFDELVTDPRIHLQSVQTHLDHLRNDDLLLDEYRVTRTAGSTGHPGIFLSSRAEWADIIASYARAQQWAGINAGLTHRARLAVVSSRIPWHQSARVAASVDSPVIPVRRFDATEPLQEIVAGLNTWQPDNLIAYASMARTLAQEQLDGRLNISPKAVMSASEVLSNEARGLLRAAWRCEPFNVYAATETAGIASECQLHRMHLFEDLVITEIVDEENQPVRTAEFGAKLLVTVLFSRTQPLIRYEISDRVMPSNATCECGRTFKIIGAIEGRAEDILELPGRNGGKVRIHPNLFHNIFESQPLKAWQVLEEPEGLRVLLVPTENIDLDRIGSDVQIALQEQRVLDPMVIVDPDYSVRHLQGNAASPAGNNRSGT